MPISAGDRLGLYEILAPIGKGGMGEVYRAHDTRLKRDVAIKVLPDVFARDPERMARFQREAEILASLNHPNIATIYGVEDQEVPNWADLAGRGLPLEIAQALDAGTREVVCPTLSELGEEVANYLITQAASSKDELFRIVAKELRGFLENVNLSGELQKLLTSLSFEIKTEIRFIPNDEAVGGVTPDVKRQISVKKDGKERAKPRDDKKDEPGGGGGE